MFGTSDNAQKVFIQKTFEKYKFGLLSFFINLCYTLEKQLYKSI